MELEYASQHEDTHENVEIKSALDEMLTAFEQFKHTNDERLDEIEKRQDADVLTEEKLARIDKRLSQLSKGVQSPALEVSASNRDELEAKMAFSDYIRSGNAMAVANLSRRSYAATNGDDGALLVPDQTQLRLDNVVGMQSIMRQLAHVQQVMSGSYLNVVYSDETASANWVGETAARAETNVAPLQEQRINFFEMVANPACTSQFVEDASVDVESWLVENLAESFAEVESEAFITGNGTSQPKGIVDVTLGTGDKQVSALKSGQATKLGTDPVAKLLDFSFGLDRRYRANASWLMNGSTLSEIRKLKDSDGNYIWVPNLSAGQAATLLGHPVYEESNMPDIAANALPIAFGDFKSAYMIIDRRGLSLLRDPYSNKPYIMFYCTRRVGGAVVNYKAYRLYQIAA